MLSFYNLKYLKIHAQELLPKAAGLKTNALTTSVKTLSVTPSVKKSATLLLLLFLSFLYVSFFLYLDFAIAYYSFLIFIYY